MKCQACGRRKAVWRVANAYQSSANGKRICDSAVCWGQLTGGYPAEGKSLAKK